MSLFVQRAVSLAQYTTLGVGGAAKYFVEVTDKEMLEAACVFAEQTHTPLYVIGGGSNLLVSDKGFSGLVIKMAMRGVSIVEDSRGVLVKAAAGESWDSLVQYTVEKGLSGLENLSGIPGTVGAAPIQNINAYGAAVADTIVGVDVFDTRTRSHKTVSGLECQFGYRDSVFKHEEGKDQIVTSVTFRLTQQSIENLSYRSASQSIARYLQERNIERPTVLDVRTAVLHARRTIGMLEGQYRSAGSFFKNTVVDQKTFASVYKIVTTQFILLHEAHMPWYWEQADGTVKISTAFLLECSPYNKRTYSEYEWNNEVGISPKHSLSIITKEHASAHAVETFSEKIIETIKKIFDVTIEREVNVLR